MSGVLRVGLVGAGNIVRQRHVPALRRHADVELAVVCNRTRESTARAAGEFGVKETAQDWREVVGRKDVDIVWIGAPPVLHAPVSLAALEAGKHVFCQARMAMDLEEALAMRAAARRHPGRVAALCPAPYGMRGTRWVRRMLENGELGELRYCTFHSRLPLWADAEAPLHFRQDRRLSGDNILSIGIYAEVLAPWIGEPQSVQAAARTVRTRQQGEPVTVPDVVTVLGEWPDGLAGVMEWSGVLPLAAAGAGDRFELHGEAGSLAYDFTRDKIWRGRDGNWERVEVPAEMEQRWEVEDRFLEAVRGGGAAPEPDFETGVRYMAVVDAVQRSLREGRRVEVAAA